MANQIYTHDEAMLIVEIFEGLISRYDIKIPSPEDDERDIEDDTGLYGSTYSELLDAVEQKLVELLEKHDANTEVIQDEFSGTV